MFTYILDSSAWLIHIFKEPGADQITRLFKDEDNRVAVSALSLVEVYTRLKSVKREKEFAKLTEFYSYLFHSFIPATEAVVMQAVEIRRATTSRVPSIDAIIAATTSLEGAVLLHRDAHFLAIPDALLQQQMVGEA